MYVSKRTRDKAMRIICEYHQNKKPGNSISPYYLYKNGLSKKHDAVHIVEILASMGYVTFYRYRDGSIREIELTDSGRTYFERKADDSKKSRKETIRYIITTAIAVLALVLSGISLANQLGLIELPNPLFPK